MNILLSDTVGLVCDGDGLILDTPRPDPLDAAAGVPGPPSYSTPPPQIRC